MKQKKFAVFDIDGTIFRWQLYHELFDAFVKESVISKDDAAAVYEAREEWRKRQLSYESYEHAIVKSMEQAIVGIEEKQFNHLADDILKSKGHHTYRYTVALLQRLRRNGYTTIAISGSYQQLVDRFAKLHSIDIAVGKSHTVKHGKLTARASQIFGRKDIILQEIVQAHNLTYEDSYAVGDSSSDIAMLSLVEKPIAFNPDEGLKDRAIKHGWPIIIERKSIAYRLEKGQNGSYLLAEADRY